MNLRLLRTFENNLKGAMAEEIAKELFIENGFDVEHYGVEYTVPSLNPRNRGNKLDPDCHNTKVIRQLPDLLIKKDGRTHLVEVKFRKKPKETIKVPELFPHAYLLVISSNEVLFTNVKNYMLDKSSLVEIHQYNPLKLSDESIEVCNSIVTKYYHVVIDRQVV